jgi:hypothetical protein
VRSLKRIVTVLRVGEMSGAGRASTEAPHESQNFADGGSSTPQDGQRGASGAPHPMQKRAPSRLIDPQLPHSTRGTVSHRQAARSVP